MSQTARPDAAKDSDTDRGGAPTVMAIYATRYGSTRGVADRIAARLREAGFDARAEPVATADVSRADAVVLGSPVFDGRWLPEADEFVLRNRDALARRPVWLFSVGTFGDRRRLVGRLVRHEPKNIDALVNMVGPRGYRVFAGVIDRELWPAPARLFLRACGGRVGDNRDWRDIDGWAGAIATELRSAAASAISSPPESSSARAR